MAQEERSVLSCCRCQELRKTRLDVVCADEDGPADEDSGDHVPVFLRNAIEKIQAVTQGSAGEVFKAVPMDINRNTGGNQLIQIGGNLAALATSVRGKEKDGNAFRGGNKWLRFLRSTTRKQDQKTEHYHKACSDMSLHDISQTV